MNESDSLSELANANYVLANGDFGVMASYACVHTRHT